ncbi:MAG: NAD(+) diphosphatase [Betaproteobacteria bacterium]|nr:NAD(+) diphosphatase [Betaproteobacteria bacterium]
MIETPDSFAPGVIPEPAASGPTWVCVVQDSRVLVLEDNGQLAPASLALTVFEAQAEKHYLGRLGTQPCWLLLAPPDAAAPPGLVWQGLRSLFATLDGAHLAVLTRALQIAEWSATHRYCGACGVATTEVTGERARACPQCGRTAYPRLSPAVMVLVTRGPELLLARGARFKVPIWSALAGFVEPGESLEDTIHREVREEVGIEISDLAYFGSQSWPFPHSLMVAFTARHAGGELQPDGDEIVEAGWFRPDALPALPTSASIARKLIDRLATDLRSGSARA